MTRHTDQGHCGCPICLGQLQNGDDALEGDERQPLMAPTFTNEQVVGQINSGASWTGSSISYGFLQSAPSWDIGYEGNGFTAFTATQQIATRSVMELWEDLISKPIYEVGSSQEYASINFANTTSYINYAHAYYPGTYSWAGEVWLNAPTYTGLYNPDPGDYYFMTILHEVGHALGLSHPGAYNGGSPTYANNAEYAQDTHQWTVMSYFNAANTGADWHGGSGWQYAQTPMVHDVLAIQSIYGADTTTRAGNTVYGFNSTAGNALYDFSLNNSPVLTIYDASGIDTLDLSGFSLRAIISLAPGTYSSVGGTTSTMTYNVGIAGNTIIENAIGGSGDDLIYGNGANNDLQGGGGNDTLWGYSGDDILSGGSGTDWAEFSLTFTSYSFAFFPTFIEITGEGVDTLADDIEWIGFSDLDFSYQAISDYFVEVEIENDGATGLITKGGNYHIVTPDGRIGLTYFGQTVGADSFAGFNVIQAEANGSSGYDVLWQHSSGGYSFWEVDSLGAFSTGGWLAASEYADYEDRFSFDINGDGKIGHSFSTVETSGNLNLLSSTSGQYFLEDSDGVKTGLTYFGQAAGTDSFAGFSAVQAETGPSGGFEVLWQNTSGKYSYWDVDSTGAFRTGGLLEASRYVDYEDRFSFDINGDGKIGHSFSTVETSGDLNLLSSTSGQYFLEDSGGVKTGLTYLGQVAGPNSFAGFSAVQAETNGSGGFDVLWQHSTGKYSFWTVDSSGAFQSGGWLEASDYVNYEDQFSFDINNDTIIGHTFSTIETTGNLTLLSHTTGQYFLENSDGVKTGLTYLGQAAGPDSFAGFSAVQAEANGSGGFDVLWQHSTGKYSFWTVDSSGAFQSGGWLEASDYVNYEDQFSFDINNDTIIGHAFSTIETTGNLTLLSHTTGQYFLEDSNGLKTGLTYFGQAAGPDSFAGFGAIQAEANTSGGFDVLWQHSSGKFSFWDVDSSGAFRTGGWLDASEYVDYEDQFSFDIDGSGSIGFVEPAHDGLAELIQDYDAAGSSPDPADNISPIDYFQDDPPII